MGMPAEFRRMKPVLDSKGVEAWALDLLGNGFCASGLEGRPNAELGPEQRRQHLYAFWKQKVSSWTISPALQNSSDNAWEYRLAQYIKSIV